MKVLVLHSELGVLRGGGENFTRNLFVAFAARGHRVVAAFVADRTGRYPFPLPAVIRPIPIKGWWSNNLGQATLATMASYIPNKLRAWTKWDRLQAGLSWRAFAWHKKRFRRRIEEQFSNQWDHFDAVYVHGDATLAHAISHRCMTVLRLPGPVTAELEPALRHVHAVCANGDALMRIRSFLGDHATELPIGIDVELFKPAPISIRGDLGWTDEHKVVGYVGRLTHLKGVDLLVEAFREVSLTLGNLRLLIVGQGEMEKTIRSILAKELANGIVHVERDVSHENLPQWYRAMDFFVMPSRYENFSNAILEAIGCGVPVLASDVGGNALLVDDAFLFQANSVDSVSAALRTAAHCSPTVKTWKISPRDILERYSWNTSAERLERIISLHPGAKK